jgi:molybdopterin-guanine dinucleotide biosynthesis protein A
MIVGGIILCGGKSTRMGYPKALLPFGNETMLQRMLRLLSGVVAPLVVVAAQGQELPDLCAATDVILVRDEQPERGPLEGLRAGLKAMRGHTDAAYVTSCDAPLLTPAFVRRMIDELGEAQVAVPVEVADGRTFHHPLAAVYRCDVLPQVEALLAADRLRPTFLFDAVVTRRIPIEELRSTDPELHSLRNLNRLDDYLAALHLAGLPPDAQQ